MEERTMKTADLITTVSTGFADKLVRIHGQKVRVIRNGYQPLTDSTKVSLPECFTISYTGTIYTGKQDPNKVLVALCNLLESSSISRDRIALNFYGRYDNALQQTIERYGLGKVALQKGNLPREEIRERQRASHLLLLLQWEDPNERGIFPLKFYEYLNAGRPILATGGAEAGEIGAILDQTCAGTTASTIPEIEWALQQAYDAYLKQGTPDYHGIQEVITSYGYVEQARLLDEAIRSLL